MLDEVLFRRNVLDGIQRFVTRIANLYDSDNEDPDRQKLFRTRKVEALFELDSAVTKQFSSDTTVSFFRLDSDAHHKNK